MTDISVPPFNDYVNTELFSIHVSVLRLDSFTKRKVSSANIFVLIGRENCVYGNILNTVDAFSSSRFQ
jgi:hypothetical protein